MPYEEESLTWNELADEELNRISGLVIGACIEVHRELGPGLDESLYEAALVEEFSRRQIAFVRQVPASVSYKGVTIGERRFDFVVFGKVIVELKAVETLTPLHKAQLKTYLKISKLRLGLLINFNNVVLKDGIKRIIL
jgi:GxxExxY protein